MRYADITLDLSKCPSKGYILAYTRSQVIFKRYESVNQIGGFLGEEDVLELHLFDRQKEYRLLTSRSKRYKKGYVEAEADFEEREDKVYRQEAMLDIMDDITDTITGKLYVLNHVNYDDAGMAVVDNYRMYVEEGENA